MLSANMGWSSSETFLRYASRSPSFQPLPAATDLAISSSRVEDPASFSSARAAIAKSRQAKQSTRLKQVDDYDCLRLLAAPLLLWVMPPVPVGPGVLLTSAENLWTVCAVKGGEALFDCSCRKLTTWMDRTTGEVICSYRCCAPSWWLWVWASSCLAWVLEACNYHPDDKSLPRLIKHPLAPLDICV